MSLAPTGAFARTTPSLRSPPMGTGRVRGRRRETAAAAARAAARVIVLGVAWGVVVGGAHGASPTQGAGVGLALWGPLVLVSVRGPYAAHFETVAD